MVAPTEPDPRSSDDSRSGCRWTAGSTPPPAAPASGSARNARPSRPHATSRHASNRPWPPQPPRRRDWRSRRTKWTERSSDSYRQYTWPLILIGPGRLPMCPAHRSASYPNPGGCVQSGVRGPRSNRPTPQSIGLFNPESGFHFVPGHALGPQTSGCPYCPGRVSSLASDHPVRGHWGHVRFSWVGPAQSVRVSVGVGRLSVGVQEATRSQNLWLRDVERQEVLVVGDDDVDGRRDISAEMRMFVSSRTSITLGRAPQR